MYYIRNGLKLKWLAVLFAIFAMAACLGTGNATQSNSIAVALQSTINVNPWITGIVLVIIASFVIREFDGKVIFTSRLSAEIQGIPFEKIPEAEFKYGKVFESSENKLRISVYHVSEDAFKNYVEACKNTEFVFEESKSKNYKTAYSDDGYELNVDYDKKKIMHISIEEGEPFVYDENSPSLDFMLEYIPQHFPD